MGVPSVPQGFDGDLGKWTRALAIYLDSMFAAPEPGWRTMSWAQFDAGKTKFSRKPLPILVPDHPDGPSILLFMGGQWRVFTASSSV